LPIANGLGIADCRLQIADCRLQIVKTAPAAEAYQQSTINNLNSEIFAIGNRHSSDYYPKT
jgi:hypothetical protein